MHRLEVVLVIISTNLKNPADSRCLIIDRGDGSIQLPTRDVKDTESTTEVAAQLLKDLTGLEARVGGAGWVELIPLPLADAVDRVTLAGRMVGVPYGGMIPEFTGLKIRGAAWVTLVEALQSRLFLDHDEILKNALSRV